MRTFWAMVTGFIMILTLSITAIALRPAYIISTDALNTTFHETVNSTKGETVWSNIYNVTNYLWWILPSAVIIGVFIYVWVNAQQKEYVTGVRY